MAQDAHDPLAPFLAQLPLAHAMHPAPLDDAVLRDLEQRLARLIHVQPSTDAPPESAESAPWLASLESLVAELDRVTPDLLRAAPPTDAPPTGPATRSQQQRAVLALWLDWLDRRVRAWITPPAAGAAPGDRRGETIDLMVALHGLQRWPDSLLTPHLLMGVLRQLSAADRRTVVMAHWPEGADQPLVPPPDNRRGPAWALRTRVLFRDFPQSGGGRALLGFDDTTPPREVLAPWLAHRARDIRVLGLRLLADLTPPAPDEPGAARPARPAR